MDTKVKMGQLAPEESSIDGKLQRHQLHCVLLIKTYLLVWIKLSIWWTRCNLSVEEFSWRRAQKAATGAGVDRLIQAQLCPICRPAALLFSVALRVIAVQNVQIVILVIFCLIFLLTFPLYNHWLR